MKKFSRMVSALIFTLQTFLSTPMAVLASDVSSTKEATEQVQKATDTTETTESTTDSTEESSTKESTESSSSSNESSTESSSSGTEPSESPTPSDQETSKKEEPKKEIEKPAAPKKESTVEQSNQVLQEVPTPETSVDQEATVDLSRTVPSSTVTQDGSIHFEKDESVDHFIREIGESARKIGKEKELYASVMIAQAILESASGQSQLAQEPNYNLFGIKGTHNGKSVSLATQEDLGNGTLYATQAGFRVYENYEDCFNDYATLLKEGITGDSNYYSGVWKSNAKTYQEATKYLTGRYATDTQYDQKLNGLIETYDLTDYDKELQGPIISSSGYKIPLQNYSISSVFGNRNGEFHRGLDMAAAQGERIYAVKSGTVIKAEFHSSWGNYVVIQHEDGTTALYAHQQQSIVKVGDTVSQSQIIGYVGSTGNSTGSHLHFELCKDSSFSQGMLVDPQVVLFGN
ncbi:MULTISPECIES: glucosaminidase domain-containing protein [Enterococcus]|uniref:glucosaminidase domain-containing protein n=1 Tax=Enterococcus TaxID=1350 RepID=UPI0008A5A00A|nr:MULTISPECIES: glucosaminidase domain-containing protein [Enterococcus]MDB1728289.1 peptidoglycan DD-metalloendopeptidase family protein [Enterococcus avium]MDB1730713.1 peptidoglycan DD-metalloendopeptidase family protein [Enterococcus avium]OFL82506.1 N-acetylmuramoyl-L-alanine amidase [Enterococcus sp. HMSC072H05]ROZ39646.1 N-acetylmuramoyl-L-alanine amidase [Enterococcus avium]